MVIVRAPVRISFGGGGTDLAAYYEPYGGFVVSAAITRYCYVVVQPTADGSIRINSADYHVWEQFKRGDDVRVEEPLILPKAAIALARQRGQLPDGVALFLAAEVPPGTGLGSSSAMSVALMQALAAQARQPLTALDAAEQACALEIEHLGKPIGKQDQYASAFGGLNTIEFTVDGVTVRPLGLRQEVAAELNARLLLFSTGQSRDSAGILREQRTDTQSKALVVDTLHHLKALAHQMSDALAAEDLDRFGMLLDRAWQEKRRLSDRVSSAAIDQWYEAAREAGAIGGKITGAGGGGFLLLYCPPQKQPGLRATLTNHGLRELAFDIDFIGAQVLPLSLSEQHAAADINVPTPAR